jgi:hypothetical protein
MPPDPPNGAAKRWEPILDWVSYEDLNLMGVESIAVDPLDPTQARAVRRRSTGAP